MPALTVEQPEEGVTVLKRVAEEKKVGSISEFHTEFHLIIRKASSFSVVKRIPEMNEMRLGEVDPCDLPGQITLTPTSRTRWFSPIPKRLTGRGALPCVPEISNQRYFR